MAGQRHPQRWTSTTERVRQAYLRQRRGPQPGEATPATAREVARLVVELAMTVGETAMESGTTAAASARMVTKVARSYRLPVHVDATYTRILVSYRPTDDSDPITTMSVVTNAELNYHRLARLEQLVSDITSGAVPLPDALARLRALRAEPTQYRTWVLLAATAMMGAGFAAFLGGTIGDAVLAAVATVLVDLARRAVARIGTGDFFGQVIGAAVPTVFALAVMAARARWNVGWLHDLSPSLVVAAGMATMLAGVGLVTTATEAIAGYHITAAAKTYEVVTMTGGIVLGLMSTLWLGLRLGIPAYLAPSSGVGVPLTLQLLACAAIALAFGIGCNMGPRAAGVAMLVGVMLWAAYAAARLLTTSHPAAAGMAAVLVGLVARLGAKRLRVPAVALVTVGVSPLMPGLLLYRGVFAGITGQPVAGSESAGPLLLRCGLTALALAVGTSFGMALAAALLRGVRKLRRRLVS